MDAKDEVKNRLSVEDVVGQYLELKKSGRNYKALSPFTSEKTPSFMVSPEKQIWHDFSSNKGGDIFSFIMEIEGVDFKEALNILARKAGVEIQQYGDGGKTAERKRKILEILELSTKYYQQTLVKNQQALNYVIKTRGLNKQTLKDFKIGYAPKTGTALVNFLSKKGYKDSEIKSAGLTSSTRGRTSDMFRGRIMIPLADREGRVVGFTARLLEDIPRAPKYINTSQTLVYDKSRHVFGLHLAKEDIRSKGYSVLVEGNLDVISSHQAGVKNVVATAGTALTSQQLTILSRLADDIRLAFDKDEAGIRATRRAIEVSQELDISLYVIDITEGKDPDELIRKDPKLWAKSIDMHEYALDWLLENYKEQYDLSTAKGKREMTTRFASLLKNLSDPVEQDHYIKELAKLTDTSYDAIKRKILASDSGRKTQRRQIRELETSKDKYSYQDSLLALNLYYPDTRTSLRKLRDEHFYLERRKQIFDKIQKMGNESFDEKKHDLHSVENYVKILALKAQELYGNWNSSDRTIEAIGLARRCEYDFKQKRLKKLTDEIEASEKAGQTRRAKELLTKYNDLLREK